MKKITVGWLEISNDARNAINRVLDSGHISEGVNVREFERKWAAYIGTKYCVAVSSGTAALITALNAVKSIYKLESRPEVITTPLTYISDANAIVLSGFRPVFVDIDTAKFCITPEVVEKYFKKNSGHLKSSIILPVDLMGYPVEMDKIKSIAKKYRLLTIEDAAEAHGSSYRDRKCGSTADAGIFSFYIAHNIQAGEMGAITTNNLKIYKLAKKFKSNGRVCDCSICTRNKGSCPGLNKIGADPRFLHDIIAYNFKTMEFPAAIALTQLPGIDQIIYRRKENVKYLNKGLEDFQDILQLPLYQENVSYLAYPIVIKKPNIISRSKLGFELEKMGVETRPLFGCIPTQQPAFAYLKNKYRKSLPNAEYIGRNGFYVGCHQYLTKADLDCMIFALKNILKNKI